MSEQQSARESRELSSTWPDEVALHIDLAHKNASAASTISEIMPRWSAVALFYGAVHLVKAYARVLGDDDCADHHRLKRFVRQRALAYSDYDGLYDAAWIARYDPAPFRRNVSELMQSYEAVREAVSDKMEQSV